MANQSARAVFDGTQDFVDVTWPVVYAARRYMRGVWILDGGDIVDVNFTIDDGTTLRIEPTARFSGYVDVINVEIS